MTLEKASVSNGNEALTFLAHQHLRPTPQNYTLAYIAINEPSSKIGCAVRAIADDGLRIRQEEADEIVALYAGDSIRHVSSDDEAARSRLQQQVDQLGQLTASAAAHSEDFTRDLNCEAQTLDTQAARTVQIVTRMIERSRQAQDGFRNALREIEMLRHELASAREDADRDGLTGLPNRRHIERRMRELAMTSSGYTIGICDVDMFKSVNDRFGHTVGDRVLKMVATSLAASCAPHLVGRWGGEEFIVIMEGGVVHDCIALLDRAREELSARRFKLRDTDEPLGQISFSAGIAVATGDHTNTPAALQRADTAMYAAKRAGRNQVRVA